LYKKITGDPQYLKENYMGKFQSEDVSMLRKEEAAIWERQFIEIQENSYKLIKNQFTVSG